MEYIQRFCISGHRYWRWGDNNHSPSEVICVNIPQYPLLALASSSFPNCACLSPWNTYCSRVNVILFDVIYKIFITSNNIWQGCFSCVCYKPHHAVWIMELGPLRHSPLYLGISHHFALKQTALWFLQWCDAKRDNHNNRILSELSHCLDIFGVNPLKKNKTSFRQHIFYWEHVNNGCCTQRVHNLLEKMRWKCTKSQYVF